MSSIEASPLVQIERDVQARATELALDVDTAAGRDQLRALIALLGAAPTGLPGGRAGWG